jgi:hypothetical protein
MIEKNSLRENKLTINSYKRMIFYFEKILNAYQADDKIFLLFEIAKLKKIIIKLESILLKIKNINKDINCILWNKYNKFFQEFQATFLDFLIFLKWNDFGAIRAQLLSKCKEKTSNSCDDKKNYKFILELINEI